MSKTSIFVTARKYELQKYARMGIGYIQLSLNNNFFQIVNFQKLILWRQLPSEIYNDELLSSEHENFRNLCKLIFVL